MGLLLRAGADPDQKTRYCDGSSVLGTVCRLGYTALASTLLSWGARPDLPSMAGATPLLLASRAGRAGCVRLLLARGAQPTSPSDTGETPLTATARAGRTVSLSLLLDTGPGPEPVLTALVAAALAGRDRAVELLLAVPGLERDCVDCKTSQTAVGAAAGAGNITTLQLLLVTGCQVDGVDGEQRSPVMLAAGAGRTESVELLLSRGADTELSDSAGTTALYHAAAAGQTGAVQALLEGGADPTTALHCCHTPDMLELLLQAGGDMQAVDGGGLRPLERALQGGRPGPVVALLQAGARVGPRAWATVADREDLLALLLNTQLERGNCCYRAGDPVAAAKAYREGVAALPPDCSAPLARLGTSLQLNLSRAERRAGWTQEAARLASLVLADTPHSVPALVARARACRAAGQTERALEDFSAALRVEPTNKTVYLEFLEVREELKQTNKFAFGIGSSDSIAYIDDTSTNCSSV